MFPPLQALNGFLMILDCQGELFFATHSIETYLGFHQVSLSPHNHQTSIREAKFWKIPEVFLLITTLLNPDPNRIKPS